jgi:hypothetical protein
VIFFAFVTDKKRGQDYKQILKNTPEVLRAKQEMKESDKVTNQ